MHLYSWTCLWAITVIRDHLSWKTTNFCHQDQHFHTTEPVIKDICLETQYFCDRPVFEDRYYCTYVDTNFVTTLSPLGNLFESSIFRKRPFLLCQNVFFSLQVKEDLCTTVMLDFFTNFPAFIFSLLFFSFFLLLFIKRKRRPSQNSPHFLPACRPLPPGSRRPAVLPPAGQ